MYIFINLEKIHFYSFYFSAELIKTLPFFEVNETRQVMNTTRIKKKKWISSQVTTLEFCKGREKGKRN